MIDLAICETACLRSQKKSLLRLRQQIAARLGASLTAVREALIQLEAEGLIIKRPNEHYATSRRRARLRTRMSGCS